MTTRLDKVLLVFWLTISAWAGPFEPGEVGRSTRWVIHLDGQAFWGSQLGTQLTEWMEAPEIRAKLQAVKTLFGTDLTTDVRSITLFGPDGDEKHAVALIKGKIDRPKLVSMAVLSDRYEKIVKGDTTIHRWGDESDKKTQYMGFASDEKMVISQSSDSLTQAIDVLQGRAPSIRGTEHFKALADVPDKAFLVVCSEDLAQITKGTAHAAMVKKSNMLALMLWERDGFIHATIQLEADSPEVAKQIEAMGQGMLAMAAFNADTVAELKPLLGACSLESHGKRVKFAFQYPLKKLMVMAKPHVQKRLEGKSETSD